MLAVGRAVAYSPDSWTMHTRQLFTSSRILFLLKVMCYISAGTSEDFREDINLFPAIAKGGIVRLSAARSSL